jgi:hypothetical protein
MSADNPYSAIVMKDEASVALDEIVYAPPAGCSYKMPTKTIEELLFNNSQMEFTSNFKEKASKVAVYRVNVEERILAPPEEGEEGSAP